MPESSRPYRHPGHAFLAQQDWQDPTQMVIAYGNFLRTEAGIGDAPPIDLTAIYKHFGMPEPLRAPLVDQQGILVDGDAGLILIKADDPTVRQRFTEGHELMELLFEAQEQRATASGSLWQGPEKERWCDLGAAELLMPCTSFLPRLQTLGVSLQTGQTLATEYQTSLMATLVQMVTHTDDAYGLVVWHLAHSRQDLAKADQVRYLPPKKLRVWWRSLSPGWTGGFVPKNKSISSASLIAKTHTTKQPQVGFEWLNLSGRSLYCHIEAMPIQVGEKACILSLLHCSGH